jgi:hypothetical protein
MTKPSNGPHLTNQKVLPKAKTAQPSPTVLIEAVTKKYKQEVVTTPPSPPNTLARFMRKVMVSIEPRLS